MSHDVIYFPSEKCFSDGGLVCPMDPSEPSESIFVHRSQIASIGHIWLKENKYCHYLTKLNISRNTVSWVFETVVKSTTTIVMADLMSLLKWEQILSLYKQA